MVSKRHGIRFDNALDAAIYALVLSKEYERLAEWGRDQARAHLLSAPEAASEFERVSRRLEDKGERVLFDLRGLYHYNLRGIEPRLEALRLALDDVRHFITCRTLQNMPGDLSLGQKTERLVRMPSDYESKRV